MPVYYDSNKIIPAPLVDIKKNYNRTGDGAKIGVSYDITVQGELIAYKGSPDSSGNFWTSSGYPADEIISDDARLRAILRKQESLKALFSTEGKWFEIQPYDGSQPMKCKPRLKSDGIQFPLGIWHTRCPYIISLEADEMLINGVQSEDDNFTIKISDAQEGWTTEFNDTAEGPELSNTFRLTHTVTAQGKRYFDDAGQLVKEAWEQARDYVLSRIGIDINRITASGTLNLPSYYQGFNHVRSESVDKTGGTFGVSETWILSSGSAIEDFTVESVTSASDGLTRVSINGSVQGLETRNTNYEITQSKYAAAVVKYNSIANGILSRAQVYAGISLNPQSTTFRIGRNPQAGLITYGAEYDNRPTNLIPGALIEQINIIDNNPTDVFAVLPIIGRTAGPILQNLNTTTLAQRQLNVQAIVPSTGNYLTSFNNKPDVSAIMAAATGGLSFTTIWLETDQENWNPAGGIYQRNTAWNYQ